MKEYGARIERGIIVHAKDGMYEVKSLTRDGIITPPIKGNGNYDAGDCVYFFIFDDGNGMVIGSY